jgi:hypothetical protein
MWCKVTANFELVKPFLANKRVKENHWTNLGRPADRLTRPPTDIFTDGAH